MVKVICLVLCLLFAGCGGDYFSIGGGSESLFYNYEEDESPNEAAKDAKEWEEYQRNYELDKFLREQRNKEIQKSIQDCFQKPNYDLWK